MAERNIVFIPVERETLRMGDWHELSKSDRSNFKFIFGAVRDMYPNHDILITTNDRLDVIEENSTVVPYEGTYVDRSWYEDSGEANFWRRG